VIWRSARPWWIFDNRSRLGENHRDGCVTQVGSFMGQSRGIHHLSSTQWTMLLSRLAARHPTALRGVNGDSNCSQKAWPLKRLPAPRPTKSLATLAHLQELAKRQVGN
jgi:hypothetical protein